MKLMGFFLILAGTVLRWFTAVNPAIVWGLVIIGLIILIAGYFVKPKSR